MGKERICSMRVWPLSVSLIFPEKTAFAYYGFRNTLGDMQSWYLSYKIPPLFLEHTAQQSSIFDNSSLAPGLELSTFSAEILMTRVV